MGPINEYTIEADGDGRVVITGSDYKSYNVKEFEDGAVLLTPIKEKSSEADNMPEFNELEGSQDAYREVSSSMPFDLSSF